MAANDIDQIEYLHPRELPGVDALVVERVARRWRVYHETYTVCTVLDAAGEAELTYRGRLHRARAGEILLFEPGELHANTSITPRASFRVLFVAPLLVEQAAAELHLGAARPHWKYVSLTHPAFFGAFARLHASLESPATCLERESRFAAGIRLLLGRCTEAANSRHERAGNGGLQRCRELIIEHYARSLTLDQLAAVSGLSRYHLVRAFAKAFGIAPHGYLIHVRIEKARKLLAAGMPAASVAAETGFADQSHFSHHFTQVTGITPGQYVRGRVRPQPFLPVRLPAAARAASAAGAARAG